ncbi:MAG: ribosomal-processing cysteine protease Prp [Treponema sp.]|nr:ribosomal-processing cysteine protease Prp [Treponema sp.]
MISVLLVNGRSLLRCEAEGHALFDKKGRDIVCAAATILLRTAAQTLSQRPGICFTSEEPVLGKIAFEARADKDSAITELKFAADFLQKGFESLAKEFPQNVQLECKLEE